MAAVKGQYTTILVDGYDLSGYSNNLTIQAQNGQIDVTPFQSAAMVYLAEPVQGTIDHAGYFTGSTAAEMEKALYDRLASQSAYITGLLDTSTAACVGYIVPAGGNSDFQIQAPVANVITVQGKWAGTGIKRGIRVFSGTISATGAQTGVDFLTASAASAGGFAVLHVTAITGTATDATITWQTAAASNFTGAVTQGTFTFSAIGAQTITSTATIGRWSRINCTDMGGATDFTVQAIVVSNGVTMS